MQDAKQYRYSGDLNIILLPQAEKEQQYCYNTMSCLSTWLSNYIVLPYLPPPTIKFYFLFQSCQHDRSNGIMSRKY